MRTLPLGILLMAASISMAEAASAQVGEASRTERVLAALNVGEGGTVCEIGAGDGEMSIAAARIVGPNGRVYASELGDDRLRKLRDKVSGASLGHITIVAAGRARTNFPDGHCDGVFMHDVYHHLSEPVAINRSIAAALKPGARVAVLDFTPPGQEADDPAERAKDGKHGISAETVVKEMRAAGLEPVTVEPNGRQFMAVLARPAH